MKPGDYVPISLSPEPQFRSTLVLDTLFLWWDNAAMLDLNDLRVFEGVAALRSFSAAARALELPNSTVSRSVARLETELGTRLLQRTTREVVLTEAGKLLRALCGHPGKYR